MGASVLNIVLSSLGIIEGSIMSSDSLNKGLIDKIIEALNQYAYDRQAISLRTGASFQAFLERHLEGNEPIKILTLSCNSTITSAITHVLGKGSRPIHVHVLESRPLFEGVKMAQAITSFAGENSPKLEVTVYTDASVGVAARGIDIVLIGADLTDGIAAVSNKVGSLPTILTAKYAAPQAKIVVLLEKEKVLPFPPPEQEENDPSEVTQAWRGLSADLDGPPLPSKRQKRVFRVGSIQFDRSLYCRGRGYRCCGHIEIRRGCRKES